MTELHALVRPLEQLEAVMEEIYTKLRDRFADDGEASALFARLAREERSHLNQVQYVGRIVRHSGKALAGADLAPDALRAEIDDLRRLCERAVTLTLDEAVVAAVMFERGMAEAHARESVAATNPELSALLTNQARGDRQHSAALETFALRRGIGLPVSDEERDHLPSPR